MDKEEDPQNDGEYAWEQNIGKAWEVLKDDEGLQAIVHGAQDLHQKQRRDKLKAKGEARPMIRYLTIIIDLSSSMKSTDFKPTRLAVTKVYLKKFIEDFFSQNPLSLISLISTCDGKAQIVSDYFCSPNEHIQKLMECDDSEGDPSLQNSLELTMNQFVEVPKYAFKEVLVIYSSMITFDPGNIFETISSIKETGTKVSIINLSAAVYILQKCCEETQGEFNVAKDTVHFDQLLQKFLLPKASKNMVEEKETVLVKMGFPKKKIMSRPVMCSCHKKLKCVVFECPRCGSYQCDVPSFCKVCTKNLMLASSAHLTRAAHHYNPLEDFEDMTLDDPFAPAPAENPENGQNGNDVTMTV